MNSYKISVNQLASFSNKSEKGKIGIIKQQVKPKKAVVSLYTKAKKLIANALISNGNKDALQKGLDEIKKSIADTDWRVKNKFGSIAALEKFLKSSTPHILHDNVFESIKKPKDKHLIVSDVEIVISPDLIIKTIVNGEPFFGAMKIHISKDDVFDREEARYVTTCLFKYMSKHFGNQGKILPELCLCVDIYGGYIKYAPNEIDLTVLKIENICHEIKTLWEQAAA